MQKKVFDKIYIKLIYLGRPEALGTCIEQECLIGHLHCPRLVEGSPLVSRTRCPPPVICHEIVWVKRLHFYLLRMVLLGRTYSQHRHSSPAGTGSGRPLTSDVGVRTTLRLSHREVMLSPRLYPSEAILWTLSALFVLSCFLDCFTNYQKKRFMKV